MKRKILAALVLAAIMFAPVSSAVAYNTASARDYLTTHSGNAWATLGLAALGTGSIPSSHLSNVSGSTVLDYAVPVLALTALGKEPQYTEKVKSFANNNQIGDAALLNDDIFALLALAAAGEASGPVAQSAKNYILGNQNSNGGWGINKGGSTDTNMTGAAIAALIAAGQSAGSLAIQKAVAYLQSAQNQDGGFPYNPTASFGRASDSPSTAWALWGLNAAGVANASAKTYLESTQASQGFFAYQPGQAANSFSAINTAYAVIALQGKTLPLAKYSPPAETPTGFAFTISGTSGTICSGRTDGPTALDIVKNASKQCGFSYVVRSTANGPYLEQIGADKATGETGWIYKVNGTAPAVGASEYTLSSGEQVTWQYGNGTITPPTSGSISAPVNVSVEIEKEEIVAPILSFTVNPAQISFGKLRPGQSAAQPVTVNNTGTVNIEITTSVSGDSLFANFLKIGNSIWQNFRSQIGAGSVQQYTLNLSVPESYSDPAGFKTGQVIFWASAK